MRDRKVYGAALVACLLVMGVVGRLQAAVIIEVPFNSLDIDKPQLALPTTFNDLRILQGSTTKPGRSTINIVSPGTYGTTYSLSSPTVSVAPTTGTVPANSTTAIRINLGWNDIWTRGSRTGTLTLTNIDDPSDLNNHTMAVSGAVVANRFLSVDAVGSGGQTTRLVKNSKYVTSIRSGSNPLNDGDDVATRVNTVATGHLSSSLYQVGYVGTPLSQFNDVDQSAAISLKFRRPGLYEGALDLAPRMLTSGEEKAVGAAVQSAMLFYKVNVVEPRKLSAMAGRVDFGNVLRGANVVGNFVVRTTNTYADSDHTSIVKVSPGGTPLGDLTIAETLVANGPTTDVPISGKFTNYWSGVVRGVVPVVSGEDAAVQDSTQYRGLGLSYRANVGIAKLGSSPLSFNLHETILSARVFSGETLAGLSSKVDPSKTLASNITPASWVREPTSLSGLYGGVGSEAVIVESTELTANSTVTMQWRRRMSSEANYPGVMPTNLQPGSWLVSDVVKIGGISDTTAYALEMSFDNRINLAFDGPVDGAVANKFPDLFLAQLDATDSMWKNATDLRAVGSEAEQGVLQSLPDFLAGHAGVSLYELQGSWGVDPVTSSTGLGHAWAIVAGSGIFAVDPLGSGTFSSVPEPSAWALLLSAGAFAYLWRKQRR